MGFGKIILKSNFAILFSTIFFNYFPIIQGLLLKNMKNWGYLNNRYPSRCFVTTKSLSHFTTKFMILLGTKITFLISHPLSFALT